MNKIIILFFFILISGSTLFSAVFEIPVINIQNPSAQQVVDVNISFSSEKSFTGYQFTLQYNQQVLRFIDIIKGPALSAFTVMTNANNPGIIRVAGFHPSLSGISGTGILLILRFQIIQEGFSNLILSSIKMSDSNGQSIPCTASSGSIRAGQIEKKESIPPKTVPSETKKTPSQPIIVSKPQPTVEQPAQPQTENFSIDDILMELDIPLSQDISSSSIPQMIQPSNNVTLLVLSEWGNPVPPIGITTFEKGDRVSCKVETEILINDMEKAICIGCNGTGSAPTSKNNTVSFIISKDSKIIWKWRKTKIEPDFLIETPSEVIFNYGKSEIDLPVKARFIGGFDSTIFLHINKDINFEASLTETCITPERKQTFLKIKKINKEIPAGIYSFSITTESEDKIKKLNKEIQIIVPGIILLGEVIIDETSKLVTFPVLVYGKLKNISSFEINLSVPEGVKFAKIETGSNKTKIFSGFSQKGKNLKISGGIFPSIDLSDAKFFNITFSFTKKYHPTNNFVLSKCFFWNEGGNLIPVNIKKK